MHRLNPADELAEIRSELARLQARENTLRAEILKHPDGNLIGRWSRVEIEERLVSRFDAALLPQALRDDPQFHCQRLLQIVRSLPLQATPTRRPGWPILREPAQPAVH